MRLLSFITLTFLTSHLCYGKEHRTILEKGSKVYVESKSPAEKIHLEKALEYRGTYNVVDQPEKAGYIIKIISRPGINYRAFAVIIEVPTGKVVQTTPKVNTFWSTSFNYKAKAMKKLAKKRLRCVKSYNS